MNREIQNVINLAFMVDESHSYSHNVLALAMASVCWHCLKHWTATTVVWRQQRATTMNWRIELTCQACKCCQGQEHIDNQTVEHMEVKQSLT